MILAAIRLEIGSIRGSVGGEPGSPYGGQVFQDDSRKLRKTVLCVRNTQSRGSDQPIGEAVPSQVLLIVTCTQEQKMLYLETTSYAYWIGL